MTTKEVFNVGDKLWVGVTRSTEEMVPCPVCFGKLEVTVILGDGSQVVCECDYCSRGHFHPTGEVKGQYLEIAEATRKTITQKEEKLNPETGELEITYRFSGSGYPGDRIGPDRDKVLADTQKWIESYNAEKDKKREEAKEHHSKSYSWHVGYHQREIKNHQRSLEHHQKKLKVMREKSRNPGDKE